MRLDRHTGSATSETRHEPTVPIQARPLRSGAVGYYGDFRRYRMVGGRVEALKAPGTHEATTDHRLAQRLAEQRAAELALRQAQLDATAARATRPTRVTHLAPMIELHLARKAGPHGKVRKSTIKRDRAILRQWLAHFGNIRLTELTADALDAYVAVRASEPGVRRGSRVAPQTIRNELHALSNLCRRAVAVGALTRNPVEAMVDKPTADTNEAEVLSREEAIQLLHAADALDAETAMAERAWALEQAARRLGDARRNREARSLRAQARSLRRVGVRHACVGRSYPHIAVILATLLYTGGRLSEILGLEVHDIDFDSGVVHLRENRHRQLKRDRHKRTVPLWPGHAARLRHYLAATGRSSGLLFPGRTGRMMHNIQKQLLRVLARCNLAGRRITPHTLRHTYATMMLQTLVRTNETDGQPQWAIRSSFDVAKKLGHRKTTLVDSLYGHVTSRPHYCTELNFELGPARDGEGP